jgi:hypothetical protein
LKTSFAFLVLASALSALANIAFTCDTTSFAADAPAGTCAALNGSAVSNVYSGIFSNANASIYISFGSTGLGQSSANFTPVSYSNYYSALASHTDDPTALASLGGSTDPLGASSNNEVDISAALASALGLTGAANNNADTAGLLSDGITNCTLGTSGCYNGVITITNAGGLYFPGLTSDAGGQVDFYSVVEHETDEVLGTISCIGGDNIDQCNPVTQTSAGGTDAAAADLFRYSAPNVRSFLANSNVCAGFSAYFSINSGNTDIADYNNCPSGGDYGDWLSIYPYLVQDAEGSPDVNLDISTDVGVNANHYPRPEVAVLDAVGFNLTTTATPEPATFGLLGASLVLLVLARPRLLNTPRVVRAD